MKNTLIFLLLVAVIVLGFLLYKNRNAAGSVTASGTGGATKAGGPVTHTRKNHNGKNVETEDCARTGANNDTCVILISYLNAMVQSGKDRAIEVLSNDTVKWVGDGGETIVVQQLPGVDCWTHSQPDPPELQKPIPGDKYLTGPFSGSATVQIAQVTSNSKNIGFCYKTNIQVTPPPSQGKPPYTIDPHIFDQGSGP